MSTEESLLLLLGYCQRQQRGVDAEMEGGRSGRAKNADVAFW